MSMFFLFDFWVYICYYFDMYGTGDGVMYVSVLVEIGVKNVDKCFTYRVPSNLVSLVKVGVRVSVPFNNRYLEGFVVDIFSSYDGDMVKDILDVKDKDVVLSSEMLELGKYIVSKTMCSMISAYQVMLPKALKASYKTNMSVKMDKYAYLNDIDDVYRYLDVCKYDKQREVLSYIIDNGCIKVDGGNSSVIRALVKRDLVRVVEKEVYRYNDESIVKSENITLNKQQREAVDAVVSNINTNNTYLLYGVTGSGKTEVYINIIDSVVKMGKNAIMLVPEISLTPQIVSRFRNRFKSDVAVMHSGMSDAERYDEYRKIKNGDVKIVVGARSAVFSPFDNIGVIIIDEEQVTSYKQDNNPRYHTRDVALFRCKYHNCPLVLGSATPSLESFARAKKGVYKLLTLKNRANSKKMPVIKIVDLKKEHSASYIGDTLKSEIIDRLNKKEQVLLLLNRRGYSSMVTCKNCGYTVMCPNCDISLTYHKSSDMLRCHYCSYALKVYDSCPKCHCKDFRDYGIGTEKLEEEVRKLFGARVVRMDLDTTSNKKSHNKIIKDFMDYKYDVLVGTQMIAKGLDFPNVTLVGVINADSSLNVPDFRSSEYTFELLTQVSGRAGRSDKEGSVVIQTYNKDHYSIMYAKEHDYYGFFNYEMNIRKKLKYPPYYYLSLIRILSKDYDMCMKEANKVGNYLKSNLGDDYIVLGPSIANTFKVNNIYHFQCIVKYKNEDKLYRALKCLDDIYKSNSKVRLEIDNSPVRM